MTVFVDTSAFYAVLVRTDENHPAASGLWRVLLEQGAALVTSNYVVLETCALLQHRLGMPAAARFCDDLLPAVGVRYVDAALHLAGVTLWRGYRSNGPSLVDCVCFALMEAEGLRAALAFDRHYQEKGIVLPVI